VKTNEFQALVGSLTDAAVATRPDISSALAAIRRFASGKLRSEYCNILLWKYVICQQKLNYLVLLMLICWLHYNLEESKWLYGSMEYVSLVQ